MKETNKYLDELTKHLREYTAIKIRLTKIEFIEKLSLVVGYFISVLFSFFIFFLAVVFISLALILFINKLTGEPYLGFLIVSIIYLVLGIVCWRVKRKLFQIPVMKLMMHLLLKKNPLE